MSYPLQKKFALTIIDDTDEATIDNVKPVYDYLAKLNFRTTKTVWVFPPNDKFRGLSLQDSSCRQWIRKIQKQGFEIALHGVGSGKFSRGEIIEGLKIFRQTIGSYPKIQINHGQNPDNMYWGIKRLNILKPFWRFSKFSGDDPRSVHFWGDYHKKYVKYTRNFTFDTLNTLKEDKLMPYKDPAKVFANYWFSASNGQDVETFNRLTSPRNINRLTARGGAAIIYTHFGSGFVKSGRLNSDFQKNIRYLASQHGWFVPTGVLLDYLLKTRKQKDFSRKELINLEFKWLWNKLLHLFS